MSKYFLSLSLSLPVFRDRTKFDGFWWKTAAELMGMWDVIYIYIYIYIYIWLYIIWLYIIYIWLLYIYDLYIYIFNIYFIYIYILGIFFMLDITVPSLIIIRYVWQILRKETFLSPYPWAAPKKPILNRVKFKTILRCQVYVIIVMHMQFLKKL